jgi:hypothetical protein
MKGVVAVAVLAASLLASGATASSQGAMCTGSQLTGRFAAVPGSAGAGNIVYRLTVKNRSETACTVTGLPLGQLLGKQRNPLPTHVRAAHANQLTAVLVTLQPGESARANARFSPDVNGTGDRMTGRCQPTSYSFRVKAPGGGVAIVPLKPPTPVCERGTLSFDAYSHT